MATEIGTETKVALRRLRRSPGFSLAAVAVLALGIGANVAIFSAVKATLLTPPPYPEPERLVLLDLTRATTDEPEPPQPFPWSYPKYRILAGTEDRLADPVAAYAVRTLTLTGAGDARRVETEIVTPDYLEVLGVAPLAGRDLDAADDAPGAEPVALLGHALWRERFGADPGVVGRTVTLNGRPVVVAGVAPPGAELQAVDRGVDPEGLLVFRYDLPRTSGWADDPVAFHQEYLERLRALPGVRSASMGCAVPLGGHCMITMVRRAGASLYPEGSRPEIGVDFVDSEFFETLGIPLLRGRTFDRRDRSDSPPVVVLNETAARALFPEGDALGRKIAMGVSLTPDGSEGAEVVGIVGDVLYDTPDKGVMPESYLSMDQQEGGSTVFVRAEAEPMALLAPARALLARLDRNVPLYGARTLADQEARATADTRVLGGLLAVFAILALLLAATGVWAVVAHGVVRRTRELGLRVALGARPTNVVALVVGQGLGPAVAGVLLGTALAWAGGRALRGLLYEVSPADPVTVAGAALFLLAVSGAAAWLPARRATRIDPMEALRTE